MVHVAGKNAISAQIPVYYYICNKPYGGSCLQDQLDIREVTIAPHIWNGKIDEVAMYGTLALTSCDAAGIYQASSNGITADLSTVYPNNLKYYNRMGD